MSIKIKMQMYCVRHALPCCLCNFTVSHKRTDSPFQKINCFLAAEKPQEKQFLTSVFTTLCCSRCGTNRYPQTDIKGEHQHPL